MAGFFITIAYYHNNIMHIDFEYFPNIIPLSRYTDKTDNKRYYNSPNGPLPSVTTILSSTQDKKKSEALAQWRKNVGETKAASITKLSTDIGTMAHSHIQALAIGEEGITGNHPLRVQAREMAVSHFNHHWLPNISHIWGIESDLYMDGIYAGATDAIVTYQGELCIFDIKTSRKCRTIDQIHDYFIQIAGYSAAFESLTGTPINHGVIALTTHNCTQQEWLINPEMMQSYKNEWYNRIELYYDSL